MPYTVSTAPAAVKQMPKHAAEIWVAAYNSAWDGACAERDDREGCAASIAYSACKKAGYAKGDDGMWHKQKRMGAGEGKSMNPLFQVWDAIRRAFADAGVDVAERAVEKSTNEALSRRVGEADTEKSRSLRTIASQQLFTAVRQMLDEMNQPAYKVDPMTGASYVDWDEYLNVMDIYYDDDGSLFALATRAGKLMRIPIAVDGDAVSLGDPAEIPLTARSAEPPASVRVFRAKDGQPRWFAVAASAVLNRVNEIDSTRLFDNFIRRAKETGQYPELSFYHHKGVIRLGQATWLAREGYLYLAAGVFDETPDGQAAAAALERSAEWGNSIGYRPAGEPELLEIVPGVHIPVYNDGFNEEISIVLERDAAAHFTHIGTEEVTRAMTKQEYEALVLMFGEARAKELAGEVDNTNRSIEQQDLVRRAQGTADTPPPEVPAATPPADQQREAVAPPALELDEETLAALAAHVMQGEPFTTLQKALADVQAALGTMTSLAPQVAQLMQAQEATRTAVETRLAALERSDADKQRQWQQDLPPAPRVTVTHRPREVRNPDKVNGDTPVPAQGTRGTPLY